MMRETRGRFNPEQSVLLCLTGEDSFLSQDSSLSVDLLPSTTPSTSSSGTFSDTLRQTIYHSAILYFRDGVLHPSLTPSLTLSLTDVNWSLLDEEVAFGSSISLYERNPLTGVSAGTPIADVFAGFARSNNAVSGSLCLSLSSLFLIGKEIFLIF